MSIDRSKLKQVYNTLKGGGYEQDYDSFKRGFLGRVYEAHAGAARTAERKCRANETAEYCNTYDRRR